MLGVKLIVTGILIHSIFLLSIFDIYFTSPIIHNIIPIENTNPAVTQRIVFFSVDGLRHDALFDELTASYLRAKLITAAFGTVHCHLPTESRPGHVALLAGFYEDPSAVTKGWKENPVDFDSIFNRSICSFSWGSPDIVNIFHKGLAHPCAYRETYEDGQEFSGDTRKLDDWVLNRVRQFFQNENRLIKANQSLFFLHLLGQDTSGHTHKPKTPKYRENLENVDRIVREIEKLFEETFPDKSTTYLLTADHGMTNWGSHGAGDPSETLAPLVTWGKGIKGGRIRDIEQADISTLLAILLGVSIPVNSIGKLPLDILDLPKDQIMRRLLLNARQFAQQFQTVKEQNRKLFVRDLNLSLENMIHEADSLLNEGVVLGAQNIIEDILKLSLEGVYYYQHYYQKILFSFVGFSYVLWILLLVLELNEIPRKKGSPYWLLVISFLLIIFIFYEDLPKSYCFYVNLPIFLCWHIRNRFLIGISLFIKHFDLIGLFIIGIECLVAGFFHREVFVLPTCGILLWSLKFGQNMTWIASGAALGLFSLLPVIGSQPWPSVILISGLLLSIFHFDIKNLKNTFLICSATLNNFIIHTYFEANGRVFVANFVISWFLLLGAIVLLLRHQRDFKSVFSILSVPFLLLSISHEPLFLLILQINLLCWLDLECDVNQLDYKRLSVNHFRQGYFFLSYICIAFFGIGNTSSLNSFDISWVRCFLTSFSPFLMTSLILFKTVIPFLLVSSSLRAITVFLNEQPLKIFLIVLIFCNIMGLNFFFLVKNTGSWLEIGLSISHYVILQVTTLFLLLLHWVSHWLIGKQCRRHSV